MKKSIINQRGSSLVEYALSVALLSVVSIISVEALGAKVAIVTDCASQELNPDFDGAPCFGTEADQGGTGPGAR
jgi:Flp pilus assembly pilin Flp